MRLDRVSASDDEWQAVASLQNVLQQSAVQDVKVHGAVGRPSVSSGNADSQTPRTVLLIKVRTPPVLCEINKVQAVACRVTVLVSAQRGHGAPSSSASTLLKPKATSDFGQRRCIRRTTLEGMHTTMAETGQADLRWPPRQAAKRPARQPQSPDVHHRDPERRRLRPAAGLHRHDADRLTRAIPS
jgi:hypothetical protein